MLAHFPYKNSRERKSGKTFEERFINSISKSKTDKMACYLAKICFQTRFRTSFCNISFALLQSTLKRNFLLKTSL